MHWIYKILVYWKIIACIIFRNLLSTYCWIFIFQKISTTYIKSCQWHYTQIWHTMSSIFWYHRQLLARDMTQMWYNDMIAEQTHLYYFRFTIRQFKTIGFLKALLKWSRYSIIISIWIYICRSIICVSW